MLEIITCIIIFLFIILLLFIYKGYKYQFEYLEETGEKISALKMIEYYIRGKIDDFLIFFHKNEPNYMEKKLLKEIARKKGNT